MAVAVSLQATGARPQKRVGSDSEVVVLEQVREHARPVPLHTSTVEKSERPEQHTQHTQKRPAPTRSVKKVRTKNLVLQIDRGNLIICLKTFVLSMLTMEQGNLLSKNSSNAHTVKEQFAPEENRDIASFNTDNEFKRAINEENIDSNIPGLPRSAVKRSHGVNVQNLIQKIENHPSATCTSK